MLSSPSLSLSFMAGTRPVREVLRSVEMGEGRQQWPLPDAQHPAEWLHRATVALDAYHDSGDATHLIAAQQALATLAQHPQLDSAARADAEMLPKALDSAGMPTTAYGAAALNLARRFAYETALR